MERMMMNELVLVVSHLENIQPTMHMSKMCLKCTVTLYEIGP